MSTVDSRPPRVARSATVYPSREAAPPSGHLPRNPGMPLDLAWVRETRVNRSAVERRAATIPTRRTVKTSFQAGWLLRAITLMDLTTLQGDDTAGRVRRLCAKARQPVRPDLLADLGMADIPIKVESGLKTRYGK
jgi:deoxyribose-phosphate aldolase